LEEKEISTARLKQLIGEEYGTSVDENGILSVRSGKTQQVKIIIEKEDKLIVFFNAWEAKKTVPVVKCLEAANTWYKDKSMFAVSYDEGKKHFARAYLMTYKGGLIVENLQVMLEKYLIDYENLTNYLLESGLLE